MAPLVFLPTPTRALFVSPDFAALFLVYSAPLLAVGAGAGWRMFRVPIGSYHGSPSGRSNPVNRTKRSPRISRGLKCLYIFIIPYSTFSCTLYSHYIQDLLIVMEEPVQGGPKR